MSHTGAVRIATGCLACLSFLLAVAPATQPAKNLDQLCKEKSLLHIGSTVVAPEESKLHDLIRSLRAAKAKAASEAVARRNFDDKIKSANQQLDAMNDRFEEINDQLLTLKRGSEKEELIEENNAMVSRIRRQTQLVDDLKTQEQSLTDSRSSYVDLVQDISDKADADAHAYDPLAKDADLLAAMKQYNQTARFKVKLGPTSQFLEDLAFAKKCRGEVTTADIALLPNQSTPMVQVVLNNTLTQTMVWDSGASLVSLSAETARKLGLKPTLKDRRVELTIANGKTVKAALMTLESVRVGSFTVSNVDCVVMPASDSGPDLLGNTFQQHFLARMDLGGGKLHLTPLDPAIAHDKPTTAPSVNQPVAPPVVQQFKPGSPQDLTHQLTDINNWTIKNGTWKIGSDGRIRGTGNSEISFDPDLPGTMTLSFKINVVDGLRPRIFLDGAGLGIRNEGYDRNFYVYGNVLNIVGEKIKYKNNQELEASIRITNGKFVVRIGGEEISGECKASDKLHLRLRAGDGWSPGTVEFYDFSINQVQG